MQLAIIGPSFFGYLEDLAQRFQARGVAAAFYDERPSNTVSMKLFLRLAPTSVKARRTVRGLDQMIQSVIAAGTTHALLVSTEVVTPEAVRQMQAAGITVVRYGFDSVKNKPQMQTLDPLVSHIASFDPEDCANLGYHYIPLYSAAPVSDPAPARDSDFFYCTTMHSNRPVMVRDFQTVIARRGWSSRFLLFYHSKALFLATNVARPAVWPLVRQISSTPFSQTEIARATQEARVVLDIHHGKQSGLTMRTFEALSLGAVLLTTNPAAFDFLPKALTGRLARLDPDMLEHSMETALAIVPPPLTEAERYYLSVERFLDQITALITGADIPSGEPESKASASAEQGVAS